MQVHAVQPNQWIQYAITAVIVTIVLALRLRGMRKMRRLRLETLWIVPAIYLLFAGIMFYEFPPTGIAWAVCAAALLVGAGIGWQRGKLMEIHVDPQTHMLNQKASPAAFLFIVVLIVVRMAARGVLAEGGGYGFHLNAMVVTDVLIALALGLFSATRLEMYLRAKRLLDEAKGVRAA
ncbi:hypothetical protein ASG11_14590 [Sphingomonas sp. Leaf357]|uniref:CcdC protein domain-containing protein n=1 Tax=Sphingomonas sp. Leaf357 TaxID=1736350 RepID=UPI0006F431AA|nr:CcdC protein domain-containing protein [Sphingomonas sp. Leaf357]KQS02028.1 hypothetical protein ASG11_14590 [Sphingomonas sp. Leaf357]